METDKPTPAPCDGKPAGSVEVDEPTVVLEGPGDSDPTVTLPATETADETADLSAAEVADPGAEETVALTAVAGESEPTVALSAAEVADPGAEETVALTAVAGESEPTVALSAAEVADPGAEETVALTAVAGESEPTVALSAAEVADPDAEKTVALTAVAEEPEATIALPKPRISPESEPDSTIALTAVPAQRTAPTVTPPPAEPTIALPAPAVVPAPAKPVHRRRLLWAIPAAAGTALIGGTIAALAGRGEPKTTTTPNLVVSEPPPSPTPSSAPAAPTKAPAPVIKVPVHTLKDFRKLVPGDPFPADAIALTIDDGPHPVWTPKILRLLEKHHVPALFCMIGNQVLGHEPTARDVAADGHLIANHTWSHPLKLAKLPPHVMLKEIHRAQDKIYSTTGQAPNLFRSPGGAWSGGLAEQVAKSGVIPMDWTTDPRDWARPGVAHITKRLLAAKPGQILLCHDGGGDRSQTMASLKTVIPALQAKGLTFVALT